MRALMESTRQLVEFYDALPIITAIRDYPELPGASSFSGTNTAAEIILIKNLRSKFVLSTYLSS